VLALALSRSGVLGHSRSGGCVAKSLPLVAALADSGGEWQRPA